ncbi:MAG TPA: VTT domain-containing protein [Steroidobacteraceae bacterium]|nr:VTT domain-containing protein [Steroidobacteraceae bacterium]
MAAEKAVRAGLLAVDRNCWRIEHASRAGFLIDADAYFKAFVEAAGHARRSILIAGWDFHSRTRLLCADGRDCELELGRFLNDLVRRRRELQVHILVWDYPMIFGLDREWAPLYGLSWKPHRRICFRYDNTHPTGGSHHQKIVVIDDAVAFSGGIDLTSRRWDTCEHAPQNMHRVMSGTPYPPFHDLMMAVEGPAARSLGDLLRERWRLATHQTLDPPWAKKTLFRRVGPHPAGTAWPASLEAPLRDVAVGISRTAPPINGSTGVREVEALYLDMIAAARDSIYIENQYFTADKVGDALAARLSEPEGPEVVIVLRELSHGWLEEVTMQSLRTRLIERLRAADVHGRCRVYYPFVEGLKSGTCIDVHSKMIVIDDEIVRIGSANLANRSMGLDTECDLTVEALGREDVRAAIRNLRAQLLGEHLGFETARVRETIERTGSLRNAIDLLQRNDRTLKPVPEAPQLSPAVLSVVSVADPEKPVGLSDLAKLLSSDDETDTQGARSPAWGKIAGFALVCLALTALWKYTPLATFLDSNHVTGWARRAGDEWWMPIAVILAYTPVAFTLFPRPLLTLFAVIAFGPLQGFVCAMLGIELSAWVSFALGKAMNRNTVRRIAGTRLNGILQVLRRRGLLAMTALRLVPIAPFLVEGVVAGAARVKFSDFMIGTALGMLPGTLTSTVFGHQLQVWLQDPSRINYWAIALVLLALGTATWLVRRWLFAAAPSSSQ